MSYISHSISNLVYEIYENKETSIYIVLHPIFHSDIWNSIMYQFDLEMNQSNFFFLIRLEIHKGWYISSLTKEKNYIYI